jgi:PAS domain-containing protein
MEDAVPRGQTLRRLPVAVAQVSAEKRFLWVNDLYAEWLSRPRDEIVGRPIDDVLGAEWAESLRPQTEAAMAGDAMECEADVLHAAGGGHEQRPGVG